MLTVVGLESAAAHLDSRSVHCLAASSVLRPTSFVNALPSPQAWLERHVANTGESSSVQAVVRLRGPDAPETSCTTVDTIAKTVQLHAILVNPRGGKCKVKSHAKAAVACVGLRHPLEPSALALGSASVLFFGGFSLAS